ncbi:MAG: S1 RNA-binding domain-containing protein, partial [Pseudothermotoga sp.]
MSEKNEKMENFQEYLDFIENIPGQVVEATVTRINPAEGISVDFGGKGEGLIPQTELVHPATEYSVGQKIKAQILKINDEEGYAVLSERKPYTREMRNLLKKAYESKTPIKGKITQAVPGGYQVTLYGIFDAFLPGSQSMLKRDQPIPETEMDFLITEYSVDRKRQRIIVSRRVLIDQLKEEFFRTHKVQDQVEGTVEQITDTHAMINFGIIKGFLPNSEIS